MSNILEVFDLKKVYSNFNLHDVSFSVPKGCIVGLVGMNGAGKSTIINTVLGIVEKDSGSIKVLGEKLGEENVHIYEDIGVVFDSLNLPKSVKVGQFSSIFSKIYKNWDSKLFFDLIQKFNIPNQKLSTLSHGTAKKVAIAIAMAHSPKLLLLDEATSGLDPIIREEVLDMLLDFLSDGEKSVLMSSHISGDLEKIADIMMFIDNGSLILLEKKDTLLYQYGIAKCKYKDFLQLESSEYIAFRKRDLQTDILVSNKSEFIKKHPHIIVDNPTVDEISLIILKGA